MHPGARLVREWNGRAHEVEVLSDGFLWKGKRFRSLSAVAREITGARAFLARLRGFVLG